LNRFGVNQTVRVRWRDGKVYETSTVNVAVESGFYSVPASDGGRSSRVEDALALVDGAAAQAMASIDRAGRPPIGGSEERFTLAVFLALQMSRTSAHREQLMFPERLAKWAAGREITENLVAEYLEGVHLGFPPRPREAEGARLYVTKALEDGVLTDRFAISMMLKLVEAFVVRLLPLNWTLERDPRARFITSDVPVVVWRKPSKRDEYEGVGVENADEVRFPLDPGKQLVLSKRARPPELMVEPHRVRRSNDDLADGCHRFLVGDPREPTALGDARLHRRPPAVRFNVGPLTIEDSDGHKVRDSEVLHMFVPRRPLRS
jgi:hypothetical protein